MSWTSAFTLKPGECPAIYATYISYVQGISIHGALQSDWVQILKVFHEIDDISAGKSYAEGKWTVKELLLHCMDAERIFAYRALRFMRGDGTELPGYDHNLYAANSMAVTRTCASLNDEWESIRLATRSLFANATYEVLQIRGMANGHPVSARVLGLVIAGHNLHHMNVLRQKYGIA